MGPLIVAATDSSLADDLLKLAVAAVLASILAWFLGAPIAYRWDDLKRQRESDLAARNEFYRIYGQFFTTWKLWDTHSGRSTKTRITSKPDHVQWSLLIEAEKAEGGFEALLIKLASERKLDDQDVRLLACFREAYQSLRDHIRKNQSLLWWATRKPDRETGFQEYRVFKALAEYIATQLASDPSRRWLPWFGKRTPRPESNEAIRSVWDATVQLSHGRWVSIAMEAFKEKGLSLTKIESDSVWNRQPHISVPSGAAEEEDNNGG